LAVLTEETEKSEGRPKAIAIMGKETFILQDEYHPIASNAASESRNPSRGSRVPLMDAGCHATMFHRGD
jgi:hypothetical protein